MRLRPCPELTAARARELWELNAAAWDGAVGYRGDMHRQRLLPDLLAVLGPLEARRVLDYGCGNGYLSRQLALRGARVTGLDSSPSMIELARERGVDPRQGVHRGEPTAGRPRYFTLDQASVLGDDFDAAVVNFVLQDCEDLLGVLATVASAVASGGLLVCTIVHPVATFLQHIAHADASASYDGRAAVGSTDWPGFGDVPYYHRPLADYLSAIAEDFDIAQVREYALDDPRIPDTVLIAARRRA